MKPGRRYQPRRVGEPQWRPTKREIKENRRCMRGVFGVNVARALRLWDEMRAEWWRTCRGSRFACGGRKK